MLTTCRGLIPSSSTCKAFIDVAAIDAEIFSDILGTLPQFQARNQTKQRKSKLTMKSKMQDHFCHADQGEGAVKHQQAAEEVRRPLLGQDPLVSEVKCSKLGSTKNAAAVLSGFAFLQLNKIRWVLPRWGATCEAPQSMYRCESILCANSTAQSAF